LLCRDFWQGITGPVATTKVCNKLGKIRIGWLLFAGLGFVGGGLAGIGLHPFGIRHSSRLRWCSLASSFGLFLLEVPLLAYPPSQRSQEWSDHVEIVILE
jgi:hypothetical protein